MWRNYPLGQRNKTTERAVGVGVGGDRGEGGWTKFENRGRGWAI